MPDESTIPWWKRKFLPPSFRKPKPPPEPETPKRTATCRCCGTEGLTEIMDPTVEVECLICQMGYSSASKERQKKLDEEKQRAAQKELIKECLREVLVEARIVDRAIWRKKHETL